MITWFKRFALRTASFYFGAYLAVAAFDLLRSKPPIDGPGWNYAADVELEYFPVKSVPTSKRAAGPIDEPLLINTREGIVEAVPGDYIMLEEDGNRYPISGEKFDDYYRVIE